MDNLSKELNRILNRLHCTPSKKIGLLPDDEYIEVDEFINQNHKRALVKQILGATRQREKELLDEVEKKFIGKSPAFLPLSLKKGYMLATKVFGEVVKELSNE